MLSFYDFQEPVSINSLFDRTGSHKEAPMAIKNPNATTSDNNGMFIGVLHVPYDDIRVKTTSCHKTAIIRPSRTIDTGRMKGPFFIRCYGEILFYRIRHNLKRKIKFFPVMFGVTHVKNHSEKKNSEWAYNAPWWISFASLKEERQWRDSGDSSEREREQLSPFSASSTTSLVYNVSRHELMSNKSV